MYHAKSNKSSTRMKSIPRPLTIMTSETRRRRLLSSFLIPLPGPLTLKSGVLHVWYSRWSYSRITSLLKNGFPPKFQESTKSSYCIFICLKGSSSGWRISFFILKEEIPVLILRNLFIPIKNVPHVHQYIQRLYHVSSGEKNMKRIPLIKRASIK